MADVVISIPISSVSYSAWLRTSYTGLGLVSTDAMPLIEATELGPDQEDFFSNLLTEASREILKLFVSRQWDVSGIPFEHTSTNVIYRFNEQQPVLAQSSYLQSILSEDVKNALYLHVTIHWYLTKGIDKHVVHLLERYNKLLDNIDVSISKLHD
jgi:hypothetical protein